MRTAVVAAMVALVCAGCAAVKPQPVTQPQIPTIVPPTTISRIPQMVDRPIPDDCELVVPVEVFHQKLGRELPGELKTIIGIPEPSLGRTGKIDCYYAVPERQPLGAAQVVIGLAAYTDEPTAAARVTESVDLERKEGATVREVDVGKKKGQFVSTKDERLVIGSLGKTTYVARAKAGVLPDDAIAGFLAALAQQSMTPIEGA
ncbi:hypothetical protein LZG04_04295 [Saccharothrix sp. S26]|uniref:hypothetical protein n=1 Tax=Saccharothrix sp. S26 TaxID=2907215 RepID=UPI001F41522C|nr:hypothetical protein [Saccharothrix sp. S26]MCE6994036.1 hypothetical protein [Saccharothrix sp. S26]